MLSFPKQRLSYKEKIKDDHKWAKKIVDYLCLQYHTDNQIVNNMTSDYERKLSNYQLYNNQINQADFERECNPLGLEVGQFKDFIQPYNKTPNKIQVLLGEELKRPFTYRTVLVDSNSIKKKQLIKDHKLREWVVAQLQEYENVLRKQQHNTEENLEEHIKQESADLIDPRQLDKWMRTKYLDAKELTANKLLKYLSIKLNIKDLKNDGYKHALISGEEVIWVGVRNGHPVVETLNTLGCFYHKSPETKFIEDGLYAGYRTYMTTGDILDNYGDYLTEKDVEKLQNDITHSYNINDSMIGPEMKYPNRDITESFMNNIHSNQEGSYGKRRGQDWLVTHIEWKSEKKIGFLSYTDGDGEKITDMVTEDFIVPGNAKVIKVEQDKRTITKYQWSDFSGMMFELEWTWVPEIWEGVRIGWDIYACIGPKQHQYYSLDNPKEVKLGYHGVIYNNMNASSVSLMDRMKPFQYLYFIVMHKLKKLIARDRGKVFHFDESMLPANMSMEQTLYYLEEMDLDIFNPLKNAESPGSYQRSKVTGSTDRSNMQHILNYISLLEALDFQISDVAGITRQREGQTSSSQAVTNAQQDLVQSGIVTEIYFQLHNKLWENVLNSLLSVAKKCYKKDNRLIQYVLSDLSVETINLQELGEEDTEHGVFVIDSVKENQTFQQLQAWGQALIQNDKARYSDLINLLQADSIAEIRQDIEQFEQEQMQMMQQQQESQMQMEKMKLEYDRETKMMIEEEKTKRELAKAEIDVWKFQQDIDQDDDGIPDFKEVKELQLKEIDQKQKYSIEQRKLDLKEKEIQSKERIAKTKKPSSK